MQNDDRNEEEFFEEVAPEEDTRQKLSVRDIVKGFKKRLKKHSKKYYIIESIRKVIMIGALCVFTYSAYELTNIYLDYKVSDEDYDNMEDMFEIPNINGTEEETDVAGNRITNSNDQAVWQYNFDALYEMNSDAVGWIKQDNIISYPILKGTDNTYYLTHNAAHKESKSGSIFVDYRVNDGLEDRNAIIYGHDMLNNSMFGTLIKYGSKSYYNEHPSFDVYVGKTGYRYYIFATYETDQIGDTYSYNFANDEEFQNYLTLCMSRRQYETNVETVSPSDKIITLSTCTRTNQDKRFIVQCVRGEKIT